MKTKKYMISCFGNYSYSGGWDNGLSLCETEELSSERIDSWDEHAATNSMFEYIGHEECPNGTVYAVFINDFGGSRNVDLVVHATSKNRAERYAKIWCDKFYPEKEY